MILKTYQNLLSFHTSVDICTPTLLYVINEFEVADQPAHCTGLSIKNIKHFVGPVLGPNCQLIVFAADNLKNSMMSKIKATTFRPRAVVVLRVG